MPATPVLVLTLPSISDEKYIGSKLYIFYIQGPRNNEMFVDAIL